MDISITESDFGVLFQLEIELNAVTQERNDLSDQLLNAQRKKDALNEELMRLRHRIEQVGETNARVNKHLEDLVKECEEKQVRILFQRRISSGGNWTYQLFFAQVILESNEKEIANLHEVNLALKTDKESLEAMLFETQNNLDASEMKRETMDRDIQELLGRQV